MHGFDPMWPFGYEDEVRRFGYARVAGVDEAGRGPLAGPVVAAAVLLPPGECPEDVMDSKALTVSRREAAYARIVACAEWAVGIADPGEIDVLNIRNATHLAMRRAVSSLVSCPDFLLVDGLKADGLPAPHRPLVRGESKSACIAAASIIAKVTRDRLMGALHASFPQYGFARHKGYGTADHLQALAEHGPCRCHRLTYAPVRAAAEARR